MTTPLNPIARPDVPLGQLEANLQEMLRLKREYAGLLAEQRHQYLDLDADSVCVVPGSSCPACLPAGSPDWRGAA